MFSKGIPVLLIGLSLVGCSNLPDKLPTKEKKENQNVKKVWKDKNPWPAYNKNGENIGSLTFPKPAVEPKEAIVGVSKIKHKTSSAQNTETKKENTAIAPAWYRIDSQESSPNTIQILSKTKKKLSKNKAKDLFRRYLAKKYNAKNFVKPTISNPVKNRTLDFSSEIKMDEIPMVEIEPLYYTEIGWHFFAKYEVRKDKLVNLLVEENKKIKKEIEALKYKAIYSQNIYFQYKYFEEIEKKLLGLYKNLGIISLVDKEENFDSDVSYLNKNLYTFFKIKNNINFKIYNSNDRNLVKFVNLSLIEKNFSITLEDDKYTLYLDINLNKIEDTDKNQDTYITTIDIMDKENNILNSLFIKTPITYYENKEKTMYELYKKIYKELNKTDFFNIN